MSEDSDKQRIIDDYLAWVWSGIDPADLLIDPGRVIRIIAERTGLDPDEIAAGLTG